MTWSLRQEDGLYLGFEKLEIQLRRRGRRRRRLRGCETNRHQDPGGYCQKENSSPVENPW
jgi:hypothetical protein